jgi:CRP-like cAMP-binding protein
MPNSPIRDNFLFELISKNALACDRSSVQEVSLVRGQTLFEKEVLLRHVYFPISSVASRIYLAECGHTAEVGMVGYEGVVGISLFLGNRKTYNEAIVHVDGRALRMEARAALEAFRQCGPFQVAVLRYARTMISQLSQIAVCNSLHSVEQRLCRWLLMTLDRTLTDELDLSHHFIAQLLAVRRESITCALLHLQGERLVQTSNRRIKLLDRAGMEATACECYGAIKSDFDRLLADRNANS